MKRPMTRRLSFYEAITEAVRDFSLHGYDSKERLDHWTRIIRQAATEGLVPEDDLADGLRAALKGEYDRLVTRGGILKLHQGVGRRTLDSIEPRLHAELERRILASADLIRLNRDQAIETTVRRFQGYATSVPLGGSKVVDKNETKDQVRKELASLPFLERRVMIDQSHKLRSSISEIVAQASNAIAAEWNSHFRQAGYNFRPDHKDRSGLVYAVRGSWASERGLVNKGAGYTDEITAPGFEVFCRCFWRWIYSLRDLPPEMLTKKGATALAEAREKLRKA